MKYGFFFFVIILVGLAFEIVAGTLDNRHGRIDLFFLSDRVIYPSSYVYYTGEALTYIAIAVVIRHFSINKHYATAFIIVESIDLIDFWITDNSLWFEFSGWPITFNIIKVVIFVLFLLTMAVYELSRDVAAS